MQDTILITVESALDYLCVSLPDHPALEGHLTQAHVETIEHLLTVLQGLEGLPPHAAWERVVGCERHEIDFIARIAGGEQRQRTEAVIHLDPDTLEVVEGVQS